MLAKINRNYVPAYWDDYFNDSFFNSCNEFQSKEAKPSVNVAESDSSYIIELAAPGVSRKNLNISIEDDILSISSEHKQKAEKDQSQTNESKILRREFVPTSFKRNFRLPETIDTDKVSARHEDGVLVVELPKKEEVLQKISRHIEVK